MEQELHMAKPLPKDNKKGASGASGGMAVHLPLVGFVLALAGVAFLALSAIDFKFFDLRPLLHGFEPVFAMLHVCGATICYFGLGKNSAMRHKAYPDIFAAFRSEADAAFSAHKAAAEEAATAHRTQIATSLKEVTQRVDAFIGGEHARLKEENDRLRTLLEGHQRQESEKVASELDSLRQKNAELEQRITQWAVSSIDSRIERKTLQAA
jgi:DNA topoisomerase VI subunit B